MEGERIWGGVGVRAHFKVANVSFLELEHVPSQNYNHHDSPEESRVSFLDFFRFQDGLDLWCGSS